MARRKPKIHLTFFRGPPRTLTLPARYTSQQWLEQVCDTLMDATEVRAATFELSEEIHDAPAS